jgi:O-antigen ligase
MVGMTPRRQWFLDLIAELGLIAVVLTVVLLGAYLFGMPRQYNPVNGVSQMVHDPRYLTVPLAVGIVSCVIIIAAVCIRAALRRRKEVQQ